MSPSPLELGDATWPHGALPGTRHPGIGGARRSIASAVTRTGYPSGDGAPAIDAAGATDRGRHRSHNEDAFAVRPLDDLPASLLLAVADGLGGARGGEVASTLAIDTLVGGLAALPLAAGEKPRQALERAIHRAAFALHQVARGRPELRGLGTTLTAGVVLWPRLWLAHVGDSRAYLWRGGRLRRLTRDHTMAQRMRDEGLLPATDRLGNWESMLWNALGGSTDELQVEAREETLAEGDALLLCSDGLTRHLSDVELERHLADATGGPAQALCDELVAAANRAGGADNITAVYARFGGPQPS